MEEWHPEIKPGNTKFAPASFSHIITFQPKLISIFNSLRNKGNLTSKEIRPWQIETKALMGKGASSSLLLSLQKSEYILGWINKVWIKFLSKRLLKKWNLFALQYSNDIFKYNLVKNRNTLKVFVFDTTQ